jgi:tetratricopeptide (TPR) repeat protein
MPLEVKTLRIVVASPSDVQEERRTVERVATELNNSLGGGLNVLLTVSRWETHAFPGFHPDGPQGLIDEILAIPDCDIFVAIFWKRFGTPVNDAASGTLHEFRLAYEAWKKLQRPAIMFYFNDTPYTPKNAEELSQCGRMIEFKSAFPKEGMWCTYQGVPAFEQLLRQHLTQNILRAVKLVPAYAPALADKIATRLPGSKGFRGRAEELERLGTHLSNADVSIIVIEGISGIGKSALTKHFASAIAAKIYLCFWYDCRIETTLDSLAWELTKFARSHSLDPLAMMLEASQGSVFERLVSAIDALSHYRVAIFLDDYHLVTDSSIDQFLTALEERGNTKAFLITRRRPPVLGRVRAIAVVEEHLNQGLSIEICREFLQDAGVATDKSSGRAIWKLTGEGHPKALQLFAYRAKRIPVAQLLNKMPVFREDLMQEWLLPLLNDLGPEERSVLVDLSVFDRPISFAGLQALFPEMSIDVLVVSLLERFLLDVMSEDTFYIHPLVREFCYQLAEGKKAKHLWAAAYYVEQCGVIGDPDFATDAQIKYLLAAWSHYLHAEDHGKATEVVEILRPPLMNRGQYEQVMQLLEKTVPADAIDADYFVIHKARLLSMRGQGDASIEMIRPLLDSANTRTAREAVLVLSTIYNELHAPSEALQLLESKRRLFMGAAPNRLKSRFLMRLIHAHLEKGNATQAVEWATQMFQSSEVAKDKTAGALALREMGASYESQGKYSQALQFSEMSHNLFVDTGKVREAAISRIQVGRAYLALGDAKRGRSELEAALETLIILGDRVHLGQCRALLDGAPQ